MGDWDRLESRSALGSVASFSLSPCPDGVISSFSSFSCENASSTFGGGKVIAMGLMQGKSDIGWVWLRLRGGMICC